MSYEVPLFRNHRRTLSGLTAMLMATGLLPALLAFAPVARADSVWPGVLTLSTTLRDFEYNGPPLHSTATNPDFQHYNPGGLAPGLVQSTLGDDGTPVLASTGTPRQITSPDSFAQWFHDVPGTNVTVTEPVTLQAIGAGLYQYASDKFYPLDGRGWNDPSYGPNPQVDNDCNDMTGHNFSFTQQIHALFTYQAGTTPTFQVTGDDDIWAFVNGHLVIDLGGVHAPSTGQVTFSTQTLANLGISDGQTYAFDLFTAQRHTCESYFKLTIAGAVPPLPTPVVTVVGVQDGATYEDGQVPPATCTVDSIDGSSQFAAGLTAPTGGDGTGRQTAVCSYTDSAGQTATASATYTIVDTTPPTLPPLPNGTVPFGPDGTASASYGAPPPATDLVDGPDPVTCTPASGTVTLSAAASAVTVSCTATDRAGNSASGQFTITAHDADAPTITVPDSITAEATGPTGAAVFYPPPTATDTVDGPRPVACDHQPGDTFPLGTTAVTCTSSDAAGNISQASFPVTVADTTAPRITTPGPRTATASSLSGAHVRFMPPTASDAVDGTDPVLCTMPGAPGSPAVQARSGSAFPPGVTTVACTSTDRSQNTARTTFTVTVTFGFGGFGAPLRNDGTSVFKRGTTVPVVFRLSGASSAISNAPATLCLAPLSAPRSCAGGARMFRYVRGHYEYDLATRGLSAGVWLLRVDLADGNPHTVRFRLR